MKIKFQDKLVNLVDSLTLDTLPSSILLIGEQGSGKHLITEYISSKFNLTIVDITKELNIDNLYEIQQRVQPYLYIIDAKDISIKEQNIILKFIEEPLKNSYIIILCENKFQLLQTVINRCTQWIMKPYTKEELKYFNSNISDEILELVTTPGMLECVNNYDIDGMRRLAIKIIDKMSVANFANMLTLVNKIDFKLTDNMKYPYDMFSKVLLNTCHRKICEGGSNILYKMYKYISDLVNKLSLPNMNKQYLYEQCFIDMWLCCRS